MIKAEQTKYNRLSGVGRFFSYFNPFPNKYRDARNHIKEMKAEVIQHTNCDKKELDRYVSGEKRFFDFPESEIFELDTIEDSLIALDEKKTNEAINTRKLQEDLGQKTSEQIEAENNLGKVDLLARDQYVKEV